MLRRLILLAAPIIGLMIGACEGRVPSSDVRRLEVNVDAAVMLRERFETTLGDWDLVEGSWEGRGSGNAAVLVQTSTDRAFPVALWKRRRFSDVDVRVRFKPLSGVIDASGGIVFRARDARNYYVVRANSLEDNLRLYSVVNGSRTKIASTAIEAPSLRGWHVLRVVAVGSRIQAYLDDRLLIDHQDETFQGGYVGLWTKADAVTEFDDLEVQGVPVDSQ